MLIHTVSLAGVPVNEFQFSCVGVMCLRPCICVDKMLVIWLLSMPYHEGRVYCTILWSSLVYRYMWFRFFGMPLMNH